MSLYLFFIVFIVVFNSRSLIAPQTGFASGLLGNMAFVLFLLWFWGSCRVTTSVLHSWMQFVLCVLIRGSAKSNRVVGSG